MTGHARFTGKHRVSNKSFPYGSLRLAPYFKTHFVGHNRIVFSPERMLFADPLPRHNERDNSRGTECATTQYSGKEPASSVDVRRSFPFGLNARLSIPEERSLFTRKYWNSP